MPVALQAGLWGLLSGSALLIGAVVGWFAPLSQRVIAALMAFGAGVLISALSFELIDEAWRHGGLGPVAGGFLGGAAVYTLLNRWLATSGAKHRKRSEAVHRDKDREQCPSNGNALALGALLDGIPESIVIGVGLLKGGAGGLVAAGAVFLSNLPEGLSSAAGMRKEGRSAAYVFGLWAAIAASAGIAAWFGNIAFAGLAPAWVATIQAVAAGAILAMIVDTMVPEAFEGTRDYAGFIAVAGFLVAFLLSRWKG